MGASKPCLSEAAPVIASVEQRSAAISKKGWGEVNYEDITITIRGRWENGEKLDVGAGDVVIIPAGTGHKKISASDDFAVLGAYPNVFDYDLLTGENSKHPKADENMAKVPFSDNDLVLGKNGIVDFWK